MTSLRDIRAQFLSFFDSEGHTVTASSPLVPDNDPTLLFTNAGMVQFKDYFTGGTTPPYPRAVTSQKCVRAGGKHNDLDNVGYTARHHTFFEMLGNFSFGDYFKSDAIEHAWKLVTKDFALDKDKLLVTIYHTDDEAYELWKKIAGLPDDKIIRIPTSDNFWAMGDTGPCGPCSEIFYDHGADIPGGPPGSPDEDGDRFIEIWNLVFMQFEKYADGRQEALPKPSIDTGMGRSCSFLMADGVSPSNEGRGYVLRRIMRRAMRHAHILGAKDPLMHRLVPSLISEMGDAYPELGRAKASIEATFEQEEERFRRTLGRGTALLDEATASLKEGDTLDGATAFKLYDTYGFPLDLTQDALKSKGIEVDIDGFDAAMAKQKKTSQASSKFASDGTDDVWLAAREDHGATEFTGYDKLEIEAVAHSVFANGELVEQTHDTDVMFVTKQTPFYAESGGQAGDKGVAIFPKGEVSITDVLKKVGDLHVHIGTLKGEISTGDKVKLSVNPDNRKRTMANHSATHIMHEALRRVLGEHVTQKGQMVDGERIRFDISHGAAITRDELSKVEDQVNQVILQNAEATTQLMNPEAAMKAGAMALFGEKYGDEVRVLSLGEPLDDDPKAYSVELCEGAVAAGIRRIEAVTGEAARVFLETQAGYTRAAADKLKAKPEDVLARIEALMAERKKLEKELSQAKKALALGGSGGAAKSEEINGIKFIGGVLDGVSGKDLRAMLNDQLSSIGSGIVGFVAKDGEKVAVAVAVTDDLTGTYNAATLVNAGAEKVGGRGGGKPGMAQAGGNNVDGADDALAAIKAAI